MTVNADWNNDNDAFGDGHAENESVDNSSNGDSALEDDLNDSDSDSDYSSEIFSSSDDDDEFSEAGDQSDDDSSGDHSQHQHEDQDEEDADDVNQMHSDADTTMHDSRHRVVVLILSSLLVALLFNFGYQLFRLSGASHSDLIPTSDAGNVNANAAVGAHHNAMINEKASDKEEIVNDKNGIHARQNKSQNLEDHKEYEMPHYPTRIYTHASLSSKNYRAGGVLSDEMLHRFEEDGVIVIRNLVSPKLLHRLDLASQMLINGQDDHEATSKKKKKGKQFHMVKNGAIFLGVPPPKDEATCTTTDGTKNGDETCYVETQTDYEKNIILSSFRDLAMYSKIPRVAASLSRLDELRVGGEEYLKPNSKRSRRQHQQENGQQQAKGENSHDDFHVDDSINLRICRDIFLTKDDDPYACGWHVDDTGFWPSLASDPGVNAWVALDDMPAPRPGTKQKDAESESTAGSVERSEPVATFALSLGSHRAPWRHEAYRVTGSTHTMPVEGYQSAADLIQRRTGSTCNIQTDAPELYEELEKNKVIYDLKRGDVIFHHRWVFHRTVTAAEYDKMSNRNAAPEQGVGEEKVETTPQKNKIFRRYSIRYAPGTATVPPGYGVELSVLHDNDNANRTLDEIVERSGPWYPKVWPHVLKKKPIHSAGGVPQAEEEIEGITELVHEKMPKAEELQRERKKQIQRLLSTYGGRK